MGRSRGGFGTKLHGVVNPLGHPVVLKVTGAEAADSPHLPDLIAGLPTQAVLADKGYDSNANREAILAAGAVACIPPKKNPASPGRAMGKVTRVDSSSVG